MAREVKAWLAALAALTIIRLVLAAILPLAPDEAYYWLWSRHLQAGYFDHPPMVALWIRAGTTLFGQTPLGIRCTGPLAAAIGSMLLWQAGEDFFPIRRAGLRAALLLNATLMVGVGAIVMTPDTPLLLAWAAGIAALGRLAATGNQRWWLVVGAAAGAMLLSKYTGLLFIASVGGWLLASRTGRAQLRGPWPWAGLALALLIFTPNIAWNEAHGWVSYFKQGGRVARFDLGRSGQYLGELLAGQIGLATPIIFGLAAAGLWRLRQTPAAVLLWLTMLPAIVFVEHVLSGRVQANWPSVLLPSACLAAAALPAATLQSWLKPALALGAAFTIAVYAQALGGVFALPARADPTALQFSGWASLARDATAHQSAFITSDEYATTAELGYLAPPGAVVEAYDRRWRYFGFAPAAAGEAGILITRRTDTPCQIPLGTITRQRGAAVIATYKLCRFIAPAGSLVLPRP